MENELQEKVSVAMVQSMIAEANGGVSPGKPLETFQKSRLSNVKSNSQRNNIAPPVDAEESIGKATEDFGGYSLGDNDATGQNRFGYEKNLEDSAGLDQSALKQRAALNINEAATPIHLSQNSPINEINYQNLPKNNASNMSPLLVK